MDKISLNDRLVSVIVEEKSGFMILDDIVSFAEKFNIWSRRILFVYMVAYLVGMVFSIRLLGVTLYSIFALSFTILISTVFFYMTIKYNLRPDPGFGKEYVAICPDYFVDRIIMLIMSLSFIVFCGVIPILVAMSSILQSVLVGACVCIAIIIAGLAVYVVLKRKIMFIAELRIVDNITCGEICRLFRLVHPLTMFPSILFTRALYEFVINVGEIDHMLAKLSGYDEKLARAHKHLCETMRMDILKSRLDENKVREMFEGTRAKKIMAYTMLVLFFAGLAGLFYYLLFVGVGHETERIIPTILSAISLVIIILAFRSIEKTKERLEEYLKSLGIHMDEKTRIEIFDILIDIMDGILRILTERLGIEVMVAGTRPRHVEFYRRLSRELKIRYATQQAYQIQ